MRWGLSATEAAIGLGRSSPLRSFDTLRANGEIVYWEKVSTTVRGELVEPPFDPSTGSGQTEKKLFIGKKVTTTVRGEIGEPPFDRLRASGEIVYWEKVTTTVRGELVEPPANQPGKTEKNELILVAHGDHYCFAGGKPQRSSLFITSNPDWQKPLNQSRAQQLRRLNNLLNTTLPGLATLNLAKNSLFTKCKLQYLRQIYFASPLP